MSPVFKALALVLSSSMKITEIGFNCGFNNVRTFNRVFKEVTGYTPSQFAEEMAGERLSIYGRRKELERYQPSYYLQRYSQKKYVENDSMTLIKNK